MDVPRPRPPHLHRQISRHGKTCWYVRIGKGRRVRLRAPFGSPEFASEYQAAISGAAQPSVASPSQASLTWLIDRYRESSAWADLALGTRRQRENIFLSVLKSVGAYPFSRITTAAIQAGIARRQGAAAHHFFFAMRGLFRWARINNHVRIDPTMNVERPRRPPTDGHLPCTEEMIAAYQERWPLGTRQRVWLDVLLYTGLRVGDAVRLGRQHTAIKTEKTGAVVPVIILPPLASTLAAGPCGDLTYIIGSYGRPLTKDAFTKAFSKAARAANVPGSAHGVRKLAATRAANSGATEAQLEAIFGWRGGHTASLYTRTANRTRLARDAMTKLANED